MDTVLVPAAQDDAREQQMVLLFNLVVPPDRSRSGLDAELELEGRDDPVPFELKSTTRNSVSTVRDFGPEHITKWRHLHWLFAFYTPDTTTLRYCYYASPADMADWVSEKEDYVRPDYVLGQRAPEKIDDADLTEVVGSASEFSLTDARRIMKNQWTARQYADNADLDGDRYSREAMLALLRQRCGYVIRRGATLNNPHIPEKYLSDRVDPITKDHAAVLRQRVTKYFATRALQLEQGATPAEDAIDPVIADQAVKASDTDDASA